MAEWFFGNRKIAPRTFAPEHASFFAEPPPGAQGHFDVRPWREKSALRRVQARNDTCVTDKVNCAGCKIGPLVLLCPRQADMLPR